MLLRRGLLELVVDPVAAVVVVVEDGVRPHQVTVTVRLTEVAPRHVAVHRRVAAHLAVALAHRARKLLLVGSLPRPGVRLHLVVRRLLRDRSVMTVTESVNAVRTHLALPSRPDVIVLVLHGDVLGLFRATNAIHLAQC